MKVGTLIHPSRLAELLAQPGEARILTPLVEQCAAQGATHIELTGELFTLAPPALLQRLAEEIRDPLTALRQDSGLTFSVHLPSMGGLDISSSVQAIRSASLETFQTIVKITSPLTPENYILHVAGMIQEATNSDVVGQGASPLRRLLLENVYRCVDRMSDFLLPETICIENLPSFPMEFLAPIVEKTHASVCLDVGHLALRGEPLSSFLGRYFERIREVHLHDVERVHHGPNVLSQQDHVALGEGSLDLEGIVRALHEHGFCGPVVLEVLRGDGLSSITRLKHLLQAQGALT